MEKLMIVSADNHAGARAEDYVPYFEPQYREAARGQIAEEAEFMAISAPFATFSSEVLDVMDTRGAIRTGGEDGAWDVDRRLKEMDEEGVAAEIVYAGHQKNLAPFFTPISRPYPAELRSAGARAHHRWFVEVMGAGKGRVFGVADPGSCIDMAAAVAELRWCADHGFVAIGSPGTIREAKLPALYDGYYEPFWRACVDNGLVLSVHTGWGSGQGDFFDFQERLKADPSIAEVLAQGDVDEFIKQIKNVEVDIPPRQLFWQLILGGVFDRYPQLRVNFSELRSDWLPDTLDYLDERFEREGRISRLKPSEYFARQCFITPSAPRPSEIAQRDRVGIERMLLGIDYPHPEGTWPNTLDWLRATLNGLTEYEARRFAGENAVELYGLDANALRAIAARIGPDIDSILNSPALDPQLIGTFHARAGFNKSAERVNRSLLGEALDADLAGMRGSPHLEPA